MEMFYKPSEAANFLGVSKITIKRWKKDGRIVPDIVDSTGHFLYSQSQLLRVKNGITEKKSVQSNDSKSVSNGITEDKTVSQIGAMIPNDTVSNDTVSDKIGAMIPNDTVSNDTVSDKIGAMIPNDTVSNDTVSDKIGAMIPFSNLDEQIAQVKSISPQQLLNQGILSAARNGGIVCLCGNGQGDDGTGIEPFLNNNNVWTYHCFKCNSTHTNINFLANYFHLEPRNDFVEVIKKSCYLFNIPLPQDNSPDTNQKDYSKFYYFAQKNLADWLKSVGGSWRGLTYETLQHFHCGFANNRVIIPYNNYHYLARAISDSVDKPKQHFGKKSIFNVHNIKPNTPTLILEGEIDVMSIWQASNGSFNSIAIGGAAEYKMLIRELTYYFANSDLKPQFIILFDNDDKDGKNVGQTAAKKALSALLNAGFPAVNRILSDEKNVDANAILQRDGNYTLNQFIQNIVQNSIRELHDIAEHIEDYRISDEVSKDKSSDSPDSKDIPENLRLTNEQKVFLYTGDCFDLDNARRIAFLFHDEIRFITDLHQWTKFYEGFWHIESGQNSDIFPLVSRMADILKANAQNKSERGRAYPFMTHKKFSPIVSTMKGVDSILITQKDLNTHKHLLNCLNGVVDLKTGKLYPHNPVLFFTQITNAAYFPDQRSDIVDKFLSDILPDDSTRAALLRFLGYSITGSCQEEKALFINGSGGNGKGTLTKLLMTCLGNFAVSFPVEGILESSKFIDANSATPAFNSLLFSRLAISEEIPAGKRLNAAKFKLLTGGDPLPIRQLYKEMTVIKDPTHTMIFSGNHLPELEDSHDPGILRRLLNINFTQSFTGEKCDETLKLRLLSPDSLNSFLSLLVQNSIEWYKSGLIVSDDMKKARQNYLDSQDFISDFINEHCQRDPNSSIPRSEFLKYLRKECDSAVPLSDRSLTSSILRLDGISYRRGAGGIRRFYGISWLDSSISSQHTIFEDSNICSKDFPF